MKGNEIVEWSGGHRTMPMLITGEGAPYHPDIVLWVDDEGMILGTALSKPGEFPEVALESLLETIANPAHGSPRTPSRVVVDSEELAEALRTNVPSTVEVVRGSTPLADEALDALASYAALESPYLIEGVDDAAMASLFDAAADLFLQQPWRIVPTDDSLLAVTIEAFGVQAAPLSIIGQQDESYGMVLFDSLEDFYCFADWAASGGLDQSSKFVSLSFVGRDELGHEVAAEVKANRWRIAGPHAYPLLSASNGDEVTEASPEDHIVIEAVARALTTVSADALRGAFKGGEPLFHEVVVATHHGDVRVLLEAPVAQTIYEGDPETLSTAEIFVELAALVEHSWEILDAYREPLEQELLRRFENSPEFEPIRVLIYSELIMDFGVNYLGHSIPTIDSFDLERLLFSVIPRKVAFESEFAEECIDELRAFYTFLQREFDFEHAESCLAVLAGDEATAKLREALKDTNNSISDSAFPAFGELGQPPRDGSTKPAKAKKSKAKSKRKAARKARPKNR